LPRSELYSEMSVVEEEYSKRLAGLADETRNPAIKAVMLAVSTDSLKHSRLYRTLGELLSPSLPLIPEEQAERIAEEIKHHIETEAEMIRRVEELLKEDLSRAERFILELILRDEKLHHAALRRIHEILVKRETLTESALWDMIWKDTAFHGAPG